MIGLYLHVWISCYESSCISLEVDSSHGRFVYPTAVHLKVED